MVSDHKFEDTIGALEVKKQAQIFVILNEKFKISTSLEVIRANEAFKMAFWAVTEG